MSVSDDFYLDADVSRETLADFLVRVCELRQEGTDRTGTPTYECDEFWCSVDRTSPLGRSLLEERFGFASMWHLCFLLKNIPHHDSHPRLVQTMQLLLMQYDADCIWLTNNEFPQILKRRGTLTLQGSHSSYSHWADFLRRTAEGIGLPYEVESLPVL